MPRRPIARTPSRTGLAAGAAVASEQSPAALFAHDMNNAIFPIRARLNALEAMTTSAAALGHLRAVKRSVIALQGLSDSLRGASLQSPTRNGSGEDRGTGGTPPVRQRTAILSILNARRASLVSQMLLGAGIKVKSARASAGTCDLCVTQPSTEALLQARRRLKAHPSMAILLLGVPSKAARSRWDALGAVTVHGADDFDLIRQALGEVQRKWDGSKEKPS